MEKEHVRYCPSCPPPSLSLSLYPCPSSFIPVPPSLSLTLPPPPSIPVPLHLYCCPSLCLYPHHYLSVSVPPLSSLHLLLYPFHLYSGPSICISMLPHILFHLCIYPSIALFPSISRLNPLPLSSWIYSQSCSLSVS